MHRVKKMYGVKKKGAGVRKDRFGVKKRGSGSKKES